MTALYLVPTPIGNLEDITLRAIRVLKEADLILAEDTRTSGTLLRHFDIDTPQQSYHSFNEHKMVPLLIERLKAGEKMALITDAGTPGISDPGFLLARECIAASIKIECLPGATSFVPALIKSGLPADRFTFEGFLPHKKGRHSRIQSLVNEQRTMIFFESPHRLVKTLNQLLDYFGDRNASVSRELTKIHEETQNGTLSALKSYYENHPPKGEIVLIVEGER